jgi:predicted DsbA family dithiol-disulfide isomerase
MAHTLFLSPVEQLTHDGCETIAKNLGLPLDAYRACVVDPKTDPLIEADRAEFKAAGGFALPTIWIGEHQLVGAQPREVLEKAIDDELAARGSGSGS